MSGNVDMAEYWTDDVGPSWVAEHTRLDERLKPFNHVLVEALELSGGETVLDIGCGPGASTVAIAEAVGASGSVTGADISATMLEAARKRERPSGESAPITWLEADAQDYAFETGSLDAVGSRFGVMFFDDPVAAFRNLRRALRAAGRLAFVCWQDPSENPWFARGLDQLGDILELPEPALPNAPGPFGLADAARTHALLDAAGFSAIEIDERRLELPFSGSVEDMVTHQLAMGPIGAALRQAVQAPEMVAATRERLCQVFAERASAEGLAEPAAAWLVGARA